MGTCLIEGALYSETHFPQEIKGLGVERWWQWAKDGSGDLMLGFAIYDDTSLL
jgi:hypothetical protein